MYNQLLEMYQLDEDKEHIVAFKDKIEKEFDGSDPFQDIFSHFLIICQNDFESVSELNTYIANLVSNLYEYNETLRFDNPVRNHIPVIISVVKSIACYEIGNLATDIQNNHLAATQLYGLALDHLLQGEAILSTLEIDSPIIENFKLKYLTNFMDSYSDFAGLENMHSSITLKHYLLGNIDDDKYTSEIYSSIGHGFYNIFTKIENLSPRVDWMPFTCEYFTEKCVQAHKKSYEMNNASSQVSLTKYYIQSMTIDLESLIICTQKSHKIFFDFGLYNLANRAANKAIDKYEIYSAEVLQFSDHKDLDANIDDFLTSCKSLSDINTKHKDTANSYFGLLENISKNKTFSVTLHNNQQGLPVVFSRLFSSIPENITEEERSQLLSTLISTSSDICSTDHENLFLHTNRGLKNSTKIAEAKEFYEKLLKNTTKLEEFGIKVMKTADEDKPKIDDFDDASKKHLLLLKETLSNKVMHFQFLLELSKVLGFEYNRQSLVTFRAIRSLISVGRKMQYMEHIFDDAKSDKPVSLTLRFKSMETISKALFQLSKYENENDTIKDLIAEFKDINNTMITLCTRDEAQIYEYSESVRIFNSLIAEVLSDAVEEKARDISEYPGYSAFDTKFGWKNLLKKADSLKKASIIHRHAHDFLVKNDKISVANEALKLSKKCEAEYLFLCALYYESQNSGSFRADEFYSKSIEAYSEAGIEIAVKAVTARKFWLREQNKSHHDI